MRIRYRKYSIIGASGALAVVVVTILGFISDPKIYGLLYIALGCLVIACAIMFSVSFNLTKIKRPLKNNKIIIVETILFFLMMGFVASAIINPEIRDVAILGLIATVIYSVFIIYASILRPKLIQKKSLRKIREREIIALRDDVNVPWFNVDQAKKQSVTKLFTIAKPKAFTFQKEESERRTFIIPVENIPNERIENYIRELHDQIVRNDENRAQPLFELRRNAIEALQDHDQRITELYRNQQIYLEHELHELEHQKYLANNMSTFNPIQPPY